MGRLPLLILALSTFALSSLLFSDDFHAPWKDGRTALVLDPYQGNTLRWEELGADPRVAGIIHRATFGYKKDSEYGGRKEEAAKRGYEWGSYHIGINGSGAKQADFYLNTVRPSTDEVLALDLEDFENRRYMTIDQARAFIERIKQRTGRYPLIYANQRVVSQIAAHARKDDVFANTPLWIARFKDDLGDLPTNIWSKYTLWQFSSEINCSSRNLTTCPTLVPGTKPDIDVNVYNGTPEDLRKNWPF